MAPRRGSVRPVEALIAPSVAETLRALPDGPEAAKDAAARQLAMQYAELIDGAALASDLAHAALAQIDQDAEPDEFIRNAYKALVLQFEHRKVMSDIGPKLLAALAECGATAKARAAGAKGTPAKAPAGQSALERMRAGHAG